MSTLCQILTDAQSPVLQTRALAEEQLKAAEFEDFDGFILKLTYELCNEQNPQHIRQLSALVIKNAVSATNPKLDKAKRQKWIDAGADCQNKIKTAVLEVLRSEVEEARNSACQVISKIGRIEVPGNQWENLIPTLLGCVTSNQTVSVKKGALRTLGYLCEDIQILADESKLWDGMMGDETSYQILTAVVAGMRDADSGVKLEATRALYNAIVFANRIMANETERTYLISAIGEVLKEDDKFLKQSAWECILQLVAEFYEYMGTYIVELGTLSLQTIASGDEVVALPAVEFWNNICDEEININNGESERQSLNIIYQSRQQLLMHLFEAMTTQQCESTESDEWTLAMAAGTCVGLCAEVLQDDILDLTLKFVNENFGSNMWQRREAAVLAYGSIMQGPSSQRLVPLVHSSFESVCQRLNDDSVAVRDSTAWTIGRVAKFHFSCIEQLLGTPQGSTGLISLLLSRLNDEPRVVQQICFALDEIASKCTNRDESNPSPIDQWLSFAVEQLFQTAQRPDGEECKLRAASYAAIGSFIQNSKAVNKLIIVEQMIRNILLLLEQIVGIAETSSQVYQSELCGCMEICVRALGSKTIDYMDRIANCCFVIIQNPRMSSEDKMITTSIAAEDALLCLCAVANAVEGNFDSHASKMCAILHFGINNRDDETFCEKSVDIVGDIARILGTKFVPHAPPLMQDLYLLLKDPNVLPALKPRAMNAIGDVALSMGSAFEHYLPVFLDVLKQATQTRFDQGPQENEDWVEFIQNLRDGVLWAYAGIIYGLKEDSKLDNLKFYVASIVDFIAIIIDDPGSSDSNLLKAIEVSSDLVTSYDEVAEYYLRSEMYAKILRKGSKHPDPYIKNQTRMLQQLTQQNGSKRTGYQY